jgi:aspartyl-tRNA(Asn)/glutamyl-tRNA(Gln) amidotransferase subunit A
MPQTREAIPPRESDLVILETAVSEINISGLPGITVSAGTYASGGGAGLLFVGRLWSEATLLNLALDFEASC